MKKNIFESFEDKKEVKEINKAAIFDAMMQSSNNNSVVIEKKGSEIIAQIKEVKFPSLKENFDNIVAELDELLTKTGLAPTKELNTNDYYSSSIKLDLPYKRYDYNETYYNENAIEDSKSSLFNNFAERECKDVMMEDSENKPNLATSKEEAEYRCKYNNKLYCLIDIAIDIKTANVLLDINAEDIYKLNINQAMSLGF